MKTKAETIINMQKTSLGVAGREHVPKHSHIETKNVQIPLSSFCVGYLLLCMVSALKYGLYTQRDFLGETNFSFVKGC